MDGLFLYIINMSVTASYAIAFVIVLRLFLKRLPKVFSYVLWFAVLFRLVIPFSFESVLSLIPKDVRIPQDIAYSPNPEISSGISSVDSVVNNLLPAPVDQAASINPMQAWLAVGEIIWITGMVILLFYSIFTTVKLYRNINGAVHTEDNIYILDGLKTPFVFGIINPKIYLPNQLSKNEKIYVLLHEQTHIKRLDHIVKPIFFLVTCIHWFNPLAWIAFCLMGEDLELSCDENVVKQLGNNIKKEYSSSLLFMSTGRKIVSGCPLAFGENNTKSRIKNILKYKKPAVWVLAAAVIAVIIIIAALISNPKTEARLDALRPMIMVNGELYLDTGRSVPAEIDESAIIGEVKSSVSPSEKPSEEGQANFGFTGAKYAHFEDNIVVLIDNEWYVFEKDVTEDVSIHLSKENKSTGMYEKVTVKSGEIEKTFSWKNVTNPTYAPVKYIADVDNDTKDEIIILLTTGYGTGVQVQDIHILNSEDLSEINIEDPLEAINKTVSSSITINGDIVSVEIKWNGNSIEKSYDKSYAGVWLDKVSFGSIINYEIVNDRIVVKVPGQMSPAAFPFIAVVEYDENLIITNIEVMEIVDKTSRDKISAYLEEESKAVFSPYYELLDFIIYNYAEENKDGNIEAVFNYTIVHKNYDRDPDTVEYIKEAKEKGDGSYQQLYNEYLQPKDMNFYLKAVIDENDNITLYHNFSPNGVDWQETEMSDYIIR
ncbi:M56 family metallopeptidase [Sedimentibacter hydroxybenzoicus DSM 7310]|uniref:M56 family metallopeptidase n=1 Tax=Sedimentibacter hydroxybenzoicus DSM 7310 TaxID=1123245 RepID=A0A974GVU0_SEDHY|nr:M56 family metallopeptidase [Sedimentibacter hydroxybenzoicus]NYB73734.1 M56 family metallopeptidase [Sedimentibacter hydroxybenzoicus DSM 7310]